MVEVGALGGVVSGVVAVAFAVALAVAVEGDEVGAEERARVVAGPLLGRRDGASLGALSRGGASTFGVPSGVRAGEPAGIDVAAPPADFRVRAPDGVASVENIASAEMATTADPARRR